MWSAPRWMGGGPGAGAGADVEMAAVCVMGSPTFGWPAATVVWRLKPRLEALAGYDVRRSADGQTALARAARRRPPCGRGYAFLRGRGLGATRERLAVPHGIARRYDGVGDA